jgi:hypothetical protein
MFYIIYKTTNLIDSKVYVGSHQTNDINDSYLGSGKYLKRAISKYGKVNFTKEILHIFNNKQDMFNKEREIVNEEFVKDTNTYNFKIGGSGGNPGIVGAFSGKKHTPETIEKIRKSALAKTITEETKQKMSANNWAKKNPLAQKEHVSRINKNIPKSQEHKDKLRKQNLGIKHKIVACPHCGKEGGERAIKRWHFNNCKNITR